MLAPFKSGVARVTVPAEMDELRPPPSACAGGVSIVVADIVHIPPGQAGLVPVIVIVGGGVEVLRRKSATPPGGTPKKVEMSTTRNLRRVTLAPVWFVTVRRMDRVPNVELLPGSGVRSRPRFGAVALETAGSSSVMGSRPFRVAGELAFSGPGAPSIDWMGVEVVVKVAPVTETS